MVPTAGDAHQGLSTELVMLLGPLAKRRGLVPRVETALFRTGDYYRVPDQLYRRPDDGSAHGAESAELVVEILSPQDETFAKLYRAGRVLKPTYSEVLGVAFETVEGRLTLTRDGGEDAV